jgi:hypothetical protein
MKKDKKKLTPKEIEEIKAIKQKLIDDKKLIKK